MIGKIKGTVGEILGKNLIIDTDGGVGYAVRMAEPILMTLEIGSPIEVYTYMHVREQELSLYGFVSREELRIFAILIGISSIGPKSAMNILSHATLEKLVQAVQAQDVSFFSHIPGVGKKTAQKILLELSSKFGAEFSMDAVQITPVDQTLAQALTSLGFQKKEAIDAINKAKPVGTLEEKITLCLQYLSKENGRT